MLNRVKLSYFQQHLDLEVKLHGGLTAIRGANEAGKSTLLRGICYGLFGAKAMPDTLDALVSWLDPASPGSGSHDVKKLKSEVDFTAENITYFVKRGKSGAEVNYTDAAGVAQRVTGQNEVTAFICRVLKVDAGAAPRLMLSNQNEIRGALEAGTKETTALIERLADFNQIDQLIDLMQERLTLGNVQPTETALDAARAQLETAQAAAVPPDLGRLDLAIGRAQGDLEAAAGDLGDVQNRLEAATGDLNDAKVAAAERAAVVKTIDKAEGRLDDITGELEALRTVKAPDNVEAEIQRRRDAISAEERRADQQRRLDRVGEIDGELVGLQAIARPAGDVEQLRAQIAASERGEELERKWFKVLPFLGRSKSDEKFAGNEFRGTVADLEAAIAQDLADAADYAKLASQKASDAALLRQQITDGSCSFCGQDFSDVPAVQAKNSKLSEQAAQADATQAEALACERRCREMAASRQAIKAASQPALAALAVVGADYAVLADDVLPPVLKWVASPYTEKRTDVEQLRAEITTIEKQQRAYDRARTKIEALTAERARLVDGLPLVLPAPADIHFLRRQIRALEDAQAAYTGAQAKIEALTAERARLNASVDEARDRLDKLPAVDLEPLQARVDAARGALVPARQRVDEARGALQQAQQARVDAAAAYERAVAAVTAAEAAIETRRAELTNLRFNNKLLKDVRAARPIIADKLWNMVLAAVSLYFSEMRGKPSVVTKGQDGFMVDGVVVSAVSLSGSALDILGLAIRVALVKTFLPACPFFVLDEPAQGCDDNRTANLLSFLSACGFAQVLLVTHEDTSESVAQNMITIGA